MELDTFEATFKVSIFLGSNGRGGRIPICRRDRFMPSVSWGSSSSRSGAMWGDTKEGLVEPELKPLVETFVKGSDFLVSLELENP